MDPFQTAERFIKLREQWNPESKVEMMMRINELILNPLITLFLVMIKKSDLFSTIPAVISIVQSWMGWIEYNNLRFVVQKMYLHTIQVGGPFIVTNDPTYMPYVFADAVQRVPVGIANAPPGGKLDA